MKKVCFITMVLLLMAVISCKKDSGSNALKHKIGDNFQGGIIIYLLQDGDQGFDAKVQHGLIVSAEDLGFGLWGCKGTSITGADSKLIGFGKQNTDDILAGCSTSGIPAKICADYSIQENGTTYDDWYLPSADELDKINQNKSVITYNQTNYWSSTEGGANYAWSTNFATGTTTTTLKDEIYRVRAIRSF